MAFLPAGQIIFAGFTPFADVALEGHAAIGGTGRYAGARGTVTVRGLRGGESSAVTVRLVA